MTLKDQTAVVGIGATPYYKRGQSYPETETSMMCTAILAALDDAGLSVQDLDGFAIYSFACDPAEVAAILGVPEVRFAASLTSGGGGCAGALGLAAAAIHGGMANVCVSVMSLQQLHRRLGGSEVDGVGHEVDVSRRVVGHVSQADRAAGAEQSAERVRPVP